jgi:hypothetical protein
MMGDFDVSFVAINLIAVGRTNSSLFRERKSMKHFMIADPFLWEKIDASHQKAGGIYKLRCLEKNGYLSIDRLGGSDDGGILYIGAAAVLSYRLASVRKAICAAFGIDHYIDPGVHPAGAHLQKYSFLQARLPHDRLCVTLEPVEETRDDPDAHFKKENEVLADYCNQFGELPPFNLKLGGVNFLARSTEGVVASS